MLDRTVARLCADASDVVAGKFQEPLKHASGRPSQALVEKNVDYGQGFDFGEQVMIKDLVLQPDPVA